jgi:hypothetical protein
MPFRRGLDRVEGPVDPPVTNIGTREANSRRRRERPKKENFNDSER